MRIPVDGMNSHPILVTGAPRSGTTWAGRMLSLPAEVAYIHEPLSLHESAEMVGPRASHWYTYVCDCNSDEFLERFQRVLTFQDNFYLALAEATRLPPGNQRMRRWLNWTWYRLRNRRPLIKDPFAVFSAEWFADHFDMAVVVLVRHPAAFVASMKEKNWRTPFSDFLDQPLLIQDRLNNYESEIHYFAKEPRSIVDEAALVWRMVYDNVLRMTKGRSNMIVMRHEDLSSAPVVEFKKLYGFLNMDFTNDIKTSIELHSSGEVSGRISRNSLKNIKQWKSLLKPEEEYLIRKRVEDVSFEYYSDNDWN